MASIIDDPSFLPEQRVVLDYSLTIAGMGAVERRLKEMCADRRFCFSLHEIDSGPTVLVMCIAQHNNPSDADEITSVTAPNDRELQFCREKARETLIALESAHN